jgi:SAM-dependent methyltransferase
MAIRSSALIVFVFCLFVLFAAGIPFSASPQQSLAPYVPTPQPVVDKMLELAQVTPKDVVYDLGCGDGRIVIDPDRIKESKANAQAAGVEKLVKFILGDAMKADVSDATVVTLYLLSSSNAALRPILTRQLKPGARIVSHSFKMGDWPPAKTESVTDKNGFTRTIYLWMADGKIRP